jgi:3-deoxy-D-manno-octulosonic-acid transferase
MRYWHAIALASVGQLDAAAPILREIFARDPNWRTLTARLPRGMFSLDDTVLARICALE